jgi:beta-lactamase regulating signal transducer with metallopeptidase domain
MKIGYKDFSVEFEILEAIRYTKIASVKIWEVLNMALPIWIFLVLLCCFYIYFWRQAITNWRTKHCITTLKIYLEDIRGRLFTIQNLSEEEIQNLQKQFNDNFLPILKKPSIDKPKLTKPWKW